MRVRLTGPLPPARRCPATPAQALLHAAVLTALAASAHGQQQFDELSDPRMPADNTVTEAIASGDVDGDGDLDLVLAKNGQNRLYLNEGFQSGRFVDATAQRMPAVAVASKDVVLGDVDGDGDLDLVFANAGQNRLYLNDGNGTFTDVTAQRMPAINDPSVAVASGDVDGDGDLDLVFGNNNYASAQQDRLFLNDGTGTYVDVTASHLPAFSSTAVALGDMDGDGDLDMIVGSISTPGRLYLNDGSGAFTATGRLPQRPDNTHDVALGDIDGDGDLDVVVGNGVFAMFWPATTRLYVNRGNGFFDERSLPSSAHVFTRDVVLGDVDGDGDLDIAMANYGTFYSTPENRLLLNDGLGNFVDATTQRMPADRDDSRAVALGDVDGDGDPDLVAGNSGKDRLYLNLIRQLDTPNAVLQPGSEYRLDFYDRYGYAGEQDWAHPLLSTAPANIPLLPFGTLLISPVGMVVLPPVRIHLPIGAGSISLTVPNVPSVAGVSLYSQALIAQLARARLTNAERDTIQR